MLLRVPKNQKSTVTFRSMKKHKKLPSERRHKGSYHPARDPAQHRAVKWEQRCIPESMKMIITVSNRLQALHTRRQDRNAPGNKSDVVRALRQSNRETHLLSQLYFFCCLPPKPPPPNIQGLFLLVLTHILSRLRKPS